MHKETNFRALAKTISWRTFATLTTMLIVYAFVGKLSVASAVGGIEVVAKLFLYYIHERVWNRIRHGRRTVEPFVLWFTGLSGSGKSTLADMTYDYLKERGYKVERLDGDTVRSIFPKTGFDKESRNQHIRRIGFLASMLEKNGVIVIASFISPYEESRHFVREQCNKFVEVYLSTSLETCELRDMKGLYKKARKGEIKRFTGIDDPYEVPKSPEMVIDTSETTEDVSFKEIMGQIKKYLD